MAFPTPPIWNLDTAQSVRDERKRSASPPSAFFAQTRALSLAAAYFSDERLVDSAKRGVARKHRHRMQLALFGQLMATFEFLLKDFIARSIDVDPRLDEKVSKAKWISVDVAKLLAHRTTSPSVGALLVHPRLGWHTIETTNQRYQDLFQQAPISNAEQPTLAKLWILRHTVAHNAGWVTVDDAVRMGTPELGGKTVNIDATFMAGAVAFLGPIAERVADIGRRALLDPWLQDLRANGPDYVRDRARYEPLKHLSTCVKKPSDDLPPADAAAYAADFARVNP